MNTQENTSSWRWLRTYGFTIVLTLAIVSLIRWKGLEPYYIPSSSMVPTLKKMDRILVSKLSYALHPPRRWDVLVFRDPFNHKRNLVKRVVGLPGEEIEIIAGDIYVNGKMVNKPNDLTFLSYTHRGRWGTSKPVTVPENCYFVLGDNSNCSRDSRFWGFVSRDEIVGKAVTIIWPWGRIHLIR